MCRLRHRLALYARGNFLCDSHSCDSHSARSAAQSSGLHSRGLQTSNGRPRRRFLAVHTAQRGPAAVRSLLVAVVGLRERPAGAAAAACVRGSLWAIMRGRAAAVPSRQQRTARSSKSSVWVRGRTRAWWPRRASLLALMCAPGLRPRQNTCSAPQTPCRTRRARRRRGNA